MKHSANSDSCQGYTCPITGFNFFWNKTFLISAVIMVIWVNLFAWIWHGNVMSTAYQATASLWRGQSEMLIPALNMGLVLMAVVATYIFMKGYEGKGWKEGVRFGLIITALFLGIGLITHATQPIPLSIIWMWTLGDFITYSVGGILLGVVWSRCGCTSTQS